jgi:Tol biopolymer transport system component
MTIRTFLITISFACILSMAGCDLLNHNSFEAGPILFISDKSGTKQLYSMNEDGEKVKRLIKNSNRPILEAKWAPDGKKIAFISLKGDSKEYPGFRRVIYVMNADGSERSQVTTRWVSVKGSNSEATTYGGVWHLNWSPDSKHLTYSRLMVPEAFGAFDLF